MSRSTRPRPASLSRHAALSLVALAVFSACEDEPAPDELAVAVPIEVVAVRRAGDDARFVEYLGETQCGGLSCSAPPICPGDASPPTDATPPPDLGATDARWPDAALADMLPRTDVGPQDAGTGDGGPTDLGAQDGGAGDARPSDAGTADARADDAAPAAGDARLSDALTADLGVVAMGQTQAEPDAGLCVPGDSQLDERDRAEQCACSAGYTLNAGELQIRFLGDALLATQRAQGVELSNGVAVATAIAGPVPDVRATIDGEPASGLIHILDVDERDIDNGLDDYVVVFSGAFELATPAIRYERGLFRPLPEGR